MKQARSTARSSQEQQQQEEEKDIRKIYRMKKKFSYNS
jgi:hypothetical protein